MITVCHLSASLVTPIGDPQTGFFYLTLTLMIYSYITSLYLKISFLQPKILYLIVKFSRVLYYSYGKFR